MKKIILIIFLFVGGVIIYFFLKEDNQSTKTMNIQVHQETISKNNSLELVTTHTPQKKELEDKKDDAKKEVVSSKENKVSSYYKKQLEIIKNKDYLDKEEVIYQDKDEIFVNLNGKAKKITDGKGKYYMPSISFDNKYIAFEEISKGIIVKNLTNGKYQHIGGHNLFWHPNKNKFLYVVSKNDIHGENIAQSNIYFYDLSHNQKKYISTVLGSNVVKPIFSEDGKYIYFKDQQSNEIKSIKFKE